MDLYLNFLITVCFVFIYISVKRMKSSSLVAEMSAFIAVICESSRETFENQSEESHKATITGGRKPGTIVTFCRYNPSHGLYRVMGCPLVYPIT